MPQELSKDLLEYPGPGPLLHSAVARRARAKPFGEGLPLATRSMAIDDPCQDRSVGESRPAPSRLGSLSGQKKGHAASEGVGNLGEPGVHPAPSSESASHVNRVLGRAPILGDYHL